MPWSLLKSLDGLLSCSSGGGGWCVLAAVCGPACHGHLIVGRRPCKHSVRQLSRCCYGSQCKIARRFTVGSPGTSCKTRQCTITAWPSPRVHSSEWHRTMCVSYNLTVYSGWFKYCSSSNKNNLTGSDTGQGRGQGRDADWQTLSSHGVCYLIMSQQFAAPEPSGPSTAVLAPLMGSRSASAAAALCAAQGRSALQACRSQWPNLRRSPSARDSAVPAAARSRSGRGTAAR